MPWRCTTTWVSQSSAVTTRPPSSATSTRRPPTAYCEPRMLCPPMIARRLVCMHRDGTALASAVMLWHRPDGDLVRGVSPTKAIMPYLMRGRNESAVYFEQQVAMRNADAFMRAFNESHPDT